MIPRVLRELNLLKPLLQIRAMSKSGQHYPKIINSACNNATLTLNHTCLRVKDPKVSVAFYKKHFGMNLLEKKDFPDMKFSLLFLSFPNKVVPTNSQGGNAVFAMNGVLELTHNWGTENDADFKVNNGNEEPHRGFGHICFSVPNIEETCKRLESEGAAFKKRLVDGRQKDIAFVFDPDGYWIELIQYLKEEEPVPDNKENKKFNHTMMRVKDAEKSLAFYQNVLGMKLIKSSVHENAKFTLYFLGYGINKGENSRSTEGLLELTHNWGTESDPAFKYHNGNDKPQGYGHICISCKDPATMCHEIEQKYGDEIEWGVKFNGGKMKNLAFIQDPDGYSIEIVPADLTL
ncbi:hypothetical protein HG535_0A07040 [Zygotorulaspora mrakii]|uniref:Lactoylglutathione lyase n=1 Tax=Zygotorulaspora mrakii TaxID=42260 RepID=A0A7H9AYV4_ZYGMR|nr:uncharacterized protein HG535_0A07040 [Zygotorulaspora mrakii]QLG70762.1 hypothetical protein HG535_0A07040 [Zygotorulaspora mrakii]